MLIFIGLSGLLFIGKNLLNAMLIDIQYKCATQDNLTAGRYTNKNELYTIMHFVPAGASCAIQAAPLEPGLYKFHVV
jgi:hypothetical protein